MQEQYLYVERVLNMNTCDAGTRVQPRERSLMYPFTLERGDSRTSAVRLLNGLLAAAGDEAVNIAVPVSGAFSDRTEAALVALQHKFGVPATGKFDAATQRVLEQRAGINFQKLHDALYDTPLTALTMGTIADDKARSAYPRAPSGR